MLTLGPTTHPTGIADYEDWDLTDDEIVEEKIFVDWDSVLGRPIKITLKDTNDHLAKLGRFSLIWRDDECSDNFIAEFMSSSSAWIQDGLPGLADTWILIPNGSRFNIFTVDGLQLCLTPKKAILCDIYEEIDQSGIFSFDISLDRGRFVMKNCQLSGGDTILQKGISNEYSSCIEIELFGDESRSLLPQSLTQMNFVHAFFLLCPSSFSTAFQLDLVDGYVEQVSLDALVATSRGMENFFLIPYTANSMTMEISTKYSCSLLINLRFVRSQVGDPCALRVHFLASDGSDFRTHWFYFHPSITSTKWFSSVQRLKDEVSGFIYT
jgi:hypothetical protein